jgi:acetoin:2,6-dichlorophenolindophenol oxidoreductase subunit alpha
MEFDRDQLKTLYENLVRARAYDELCIKKLGEGKMLGFYHSSMGGEAPGVGAYSFLRKDDPIWTHLRGHGIPHMLSKGIDVKYYLAEHFGKSTGMCAGMSTFHACVPEYGLYGSSGSIGSCFPITLGYGLAAKKNGTEQVVVCSFGDGTIGRGTFHEAAIMAANWKLPIVYVCENNKLSMFVSFKKAHPVENIADLSYGYGIPSDIVDGQDVVAVAEAVGVAVERARKGKGPYLIECKCERFDPHAIGIPDLVGGEIRDTEEVEALKKRRDPIVLCQEKLEVMGVLNSKDIETVQEKARLEVADAERFAEESTVCEPSCLEGALYTE